MNEAGDYARYRELLRYVRFSENDAAVLRRLSAAARPELDRIARAFYERSREHAEAHAVFADDAQIARLHRSLVAWLERVLNGPYDESYCAQTARIGHVHVKVGLPQRYIFSAMSLIRLELHRIAFAAMPEEAPAACDAVARILDVELAMMTESYAQAQDERRARIAQEKHGAAASAQRWVSAVQHADEIMIGLDERGGILLFNQAAEAATGYAPDEVMGATFEAVALCHDETPFAERLRQALALSPGESIELDCPFRTRAGKERHFAGRLCRHEQPDELAVFLIGRDVTRVRASEAQLRRTEKLAAVGTLAAGLAHEIRNPLNGAQLHLTFLRRGLVKQDPESELLPAAAVVSSEIDRLGALVSEFLEFARPQPLHRTETSVQALCARCIDLMADLAKAADVEMVAQLPDAPLIADIDPAKMEQVLLNLLRNAIEAISAGGTVTLRATRRPRDAIIEVEDSGGGLAAEEPIWDAFYSSKEGGTGLGLAIVHRIVSDHGGIISVESRPGKTVFRVELPLSNPEVPPRSLLP